MMTCEICYVYSKGMNDSKKKCWKFTSTNKIYIFCSSLVKEISQKK